MSDREELAKPRIITIHGVNSKGDWQEEVAAALGVFFTFEPIKYNHYRWLFGTELLFNPFMWIPLGVALVFAIVKRWIQGGWEIAFALLVIAALAHFGSYRYRSWAERTVRERLSKKFAGAGAPPHLIAHSFGTYISGRALRFLAWPYFNRIVLAGCVLDGNYPWGEIRQNSPTRFEEVRNEMAARDNIARLAAKLDSLIPGFGSAGYSGFKGSVDWVHDVNSANTVCSICEKSKAKVLLHNVKSEELGHSDVFLGPAYAVMYWLPFLWRYDPPAYRNFLALCFKIDEATKSKDKQRMKENYLAVRDSAWGQTPRRTLEEEIRYTVPVPTGRTLSEAEMDLIATETVRFVLLGQGALDNPQTAERAKFVQLLNIFVAIDSAWRKAFPQWQT
jgi:hypothetical protein